MPFKILIENKDQLDAYRLSRTPEKVYENFTEAIRDLKSEDELLIMPGRYYSVSKRDEEYHLAAEIRTSVIKDIKIEGYIPASREEAAINGSEVIIDGSIPELSNREAWIKSTEVANAVFSHEQVYVTKEAYSLFGVLEMTGYIEIDGKQYALTNYRNALEAVNNSGEVLVSKEDCLRIKRACFTSNEDFFWNEAGNFQSSYIGPGFWYDAESKKIYVRLDPLSADVVGEERTFPMSFEDFFNPERNRKLLFCLTGDSAIRIPQSREKENLKIKNLKFRNQTRGIFSLPNAKNIEIDNCEFITNQAISVGRNSQEVTIRNCTFDGALPPWISWGDVKGGVIDFHRKVNLGDTSHAGHNAEMLVFGPGSGSNTHDINDTSQYNQVINCHFTNCFDAIQIQADNHALAGARNVYIHNNTFQDVRDDCVYLGASCHHVIVLHNEMRSVGTGFAIVGGSDESLTLSDNELGTIFIHHNLIECVPVYAGRIFCNNSSSVDEPHFKRIGQYALQTFTTTHGGVGHNFSPRKIYNNTVILQGNTDEVSNLRRSGPISKRPKISAEYSGKRLPIAITEARHRHEVFNNVFMQYSELFMMTPSLSHQQEFFDGNVYFREIDDSSTVELIKVKRETGTPLPFNNLTELQRNEEVNWERNGKEGDPELGPDFYPQPHGLAAETFVSLTAKTYLPEDGRDSNYCGAFPPGLPGGCLPAWIAKFMQSIVRN